MLDAYHTEAARTEVAVASATSGNWHSWGEPSRRSISSAEVYLFEEAQFFGETFLSQMLISYMSFIQMYTFSYIYIIFSGFFLGRLPS